jgi:hypothetical protein
MKSVKLVILLALVIFVALAFMPGCGKAAKIKDAYIAEATSTLDDYTAKIDDLSTKAAALPSPLKEEAMAKVDLVKAKMTEGKAKLEELKGASPDKWTTLMTDLKDIIVQLGTLYNDAAAAVSK